MGQFWMVFLPPESENDQRWNRNNILKNYLGKADLGEEDKQNCIYWIKMCGKTLSLDT